jgi:hypothetical protein
MLYLDGQSVLPSIGKEGGLPVAVTDLQVILSWCQEGHLCLDHRLGVPDQELRLVLSAVRSNPEHALVPVLMQEVTTQPQTPDLHNLTRDEAGLSGSLRLLIFFILAPTGPS